MNIFIKNTFCYNKYIFILHMEGLNIMDNKDTGHYRTVQQRVGSPQSP